MSRRVLLYLLVVFLIVFLSITAAKPIALISKM